MVKKGISSLCFISSYIKQIHVLNDYKKHLENLIWLRNFGTKAHIINQLSFLDDHFSQNKTADEKEKYSSVSILCNNEPHKNSCRKIQFYY